MPIVHSSGKTMNKDYTITIQSTITKCFPALIFWLCFHYLVPRRLPREVNLRCGQGGEKELRPPGVTSFLYPSRGLSRFVTSYSRVSQPKCVMKHLIAGAGRCIQVPCWGRYRGLKSIKTCERKQINLHGITASVHMRFRVKIPQNGVSKTENIFSCGHTAVNAEVCMCP